MLENLFKEAVEKKKKKNEEKNAKKQGDVEMTE